jgi:2-polyprenyl-6-methoxyphenol hydroxylase-like FAD-dependent oxidoreductase
MAGVLPIGSPPGSPPSAAVFWSLPLRDLDRWQDMPLDDWKRDATTLWPDITPFLAPVTAHAQMTPARYSHGTLRRPFAPALAFIGDAAHRASPQLGQGANMALLDSFALSWALTRETGDDALALYARSRRWHVRLYQMMSAAFTPQYQSDSTVLPVLRDRILAPLSSLSPMQAILSRLVSGTLIPPVAGHP